MLACLISTQLLLHLSSLTKESLEKNFIRKRVSAIIFTPAPQYRDQSCKILDRHFLNADQHFTESVDYYTTDKFHQPPPFRITTL